jgi:hypothetical protein
MGLALIAFMRLPRLQTPGSGVTPGFGVQYEYGFDAAKVFQASRPILDEASSLAGE